MTDFQVKYVDDRGDFQETVITSIDTRTAINNTFELCPDAKRIIRCYPKEMFDQ